MKKKKGRDYCTQLATRPSAIAAMLAMAGNSRSPTAEAGTLAPQKRPAQQSYFLDTVGKASLYTFTRCQASNWKTACLYEGQWDTEKIMIVSVPDGLRYKY